MPATVKPANVQSKTDQNLAAAVISIIGLRTAINAAFRAPLPFLVYFAAAFGAPISSVGWLGAAFALSGLVGPFAGVLEERLGRKGAMIASISLFVLACLGIPLAPTLGVAALCFVLLGVAKSLYEPQSTAFLGEHVPYQRRGTVIGLVELSWALAWILGVPLFGWLIEIGRWWLPFVIAAFVALAFGLAVLRYASHRARDAPVHRAMTAQGVRALLRTPNALRILAFSGIIIAVGQLVTLVYSPWFQQKFALAPARLGVVSIVIGMADLVAELATIFLVDRFGKRQSLLGGAALYASSLIFFWLAGGDFTLALVALFCIFFFFEFIVVTSLTVQSETVPTARATMAGFGQATNALARISMSLVALPLFTAGSLLLPMWIGTAMIMVAMVLGWRLGDSKTSQLS